MRRLRAWVSNERNTARVKALVRALVCVQFLLIAAAVFHSTDYWLYRGWWARPLTYWSSMNYSIWRFGFFSPDVGKSREVEIRIRTEGQSEQRFSTLEGFDFFTSNRESLNRFYGFKTEMAREGAFQDLGARSTVVRMLNELHIYHSAEVDYILRSIRYPTMKRFREREPAQVVEAFSTTFVTQ